MGNYRVIIRFKNLGILKKDIAKAYGCSWNTVTHVNKKTEEKGIGRESAPGFGNKELFEQLYFQAILCEKEKA